jgi:hypothetical protein
MCVQLNPISPPLSVQSERAHSAVRPGNLKLRRNLFRVWFTQRINPKAGTARGAAKQLTVHDLQAARRTRVSLFPLIEISVDRRHDGAQIGFHQAKLGA